VSDRALPLALRRRDDAEAVRDDILPYLGSSIEERSAILSALCRESAALIASRPDGERILAHQDPRSPESERLWLRLVARARGE
jgi:hypothetical protein